MNADDDREYMAWWSQHGEMDDPAIEYGAWCAGKASRPTPREADLTSCVSQASNQTISNR